jgi:GTP-binding protein
LDREMIDKVKITIKSGSGGSGAVSGRHEKYVPRGGPDGGDGGRGGNVIIVGDRNENTLLNFRYKRIFVAGDGGNGAGAKKHGSDGEDITVPVPLGTQIIDKNDRFIADVDIDGQGFIIANGGRGGYGNVKYASSTNQYPVIAQAGESGVEMELRLELKLLADVGIVGKPNAGKSTLLSFVTAATPKIADYPFTTLEPNLGVVDHRDMDFVMVDIPGLIEGANEGIGLGHEFLRHIERTKVLVHLVDGSDEDPGNSYKQIINELKLYDVNLLDKPRVVAINKVDIDDVRILIDDIADLIGEDDVNCHIVSAATGEGLESLMDEVIQLLVAPEIEINRGFKPLFNFDKPESEKIVVIDEMVSTFEQGIPILRPESRRRGVKVSVDGELFVVDAPGVERIARRIDYEDWKARMQFYKHLKKTGVVKALEDAGIQAGDTVQIGSVEWEWD